MTSPVLREAQRLYQMGLAIHWLHHKQKRPIESGWGSGPRKNWEHLGQTFDEQFNVGVRLGTPSKIKGGYLAVVDVDIKSTDPRHLTEALERAKAVLGGIAGPIVMSGRGNGSRHYYVRTASPFKTFNPAVSEEFVKVHMPSKKPSKRELSELTAKEIGEGIRISHAWEISLYSDGRQVVLPPSIHPDTGKPYIWKRNFKSVEDLPLVEFGKPAAAPGGELNGEPLVVKNLEKEIINDITFTKVELSWLPISDKVKSAIESGQGVGDRSAYLLPATTALFSAGLGRDEILSVLTDPANWLASCAYEHAQTQSRKKAAEWLYKYTVKKVLTERSPETAFKGEPVVEAKKLSEDEAKAQSEELESETDWRQDLVRGGKEGMGPPIQTIQNVVLILTNTVSPSLVRKNEFANRDTYSMDTPWGSRKDCIVSDEDIPRIVYWLSQRYKFEPNDRVIYGALTVIACKNAFDPVRDMLDRLPAWDGKPRLGTWLKDHFEAEGDDEYLNQVFSKWLAAMVRRIYEPGAKFDWMPIFEGPQGAGKSSFGRILVGDEYFVDWLPNLADKDSALGLQGRWCVEMGELSQFRKTELETIKAFITRTVDKFRPPHGRKLIDSSRRCVFFGTTNRQTYLIDDTGNRRFKPIKVGRLDFETLRAERDQLFAEAKHLYRTKFNTDLSFELTGQAKIFEAIIHQEKLVEDEADVMFLAMQDFIKKVEDGNAQFDREKFRILELFQGVGPLAKWPQNQRNIMFAAKMLKKFGGQKRHVKGYVYWKIGEGDTFVDQCITPDFY